MVVVIEHGKRVFFVCFFFQALMSLCFLSDEVARVLKMLVFFFPVFWLCGVASSCLFVFGRFGCFCVSCFWFSFCCWFVSVCLFCFVLWLDVVVSVSVFFVVFVFFVFFLLIFGWGFKGQVRWPKGPPHLALNPPYFLFLFWFCLFVFVFVFFGRFKGQVRWPKGPPHLALNPPYFLFVFFCCFLSLFFYRKNLFSPIKRTIFVCLSVFPFVSL